MDNLLTLFIILTPMFVGFALPKNAHLSHTSERLLSGFVFLILIVIGIELGLVENLWQKLGNIALYLGVLAVLTIGAGLVSLAIFDKLSPCPHRHTQTNTERPRILANLHGSFIQLGCLAFGFMLAHFLPHQYLPPKWSNTALLVCLLFTVGISLKNANIALKEVLLNKRGLIISAIFIGAVLGAGLIFALLFDEVSWQMGLALASGLGWYSLSGSIITEAYGAVWGSVALLNDLTREIIALIFIPYVMRYSSSSAIGLGGVTSLDFTLPTLQKAGGNEIVPLVISFGFITNVVSPVLMVFFSALG